MKLISIAYLWLSLGFRLAHCVLELPVFSNEAGLHRRSALRPRQSQGYVQDTLSYDPRWNAYGGYYIDLAVGNPPQRQSVWIRTWFSDTYFNSVNASSCKSSPDASTGICRGGTFNTSASTTYRPANISDDFAISYGGGGSASGPFGNDTLRVGSLVLEGVQFAVAEDIDGGGIYSIGVMGLGYSADEEAARLNQSTPYQNIPEVMVGANVTASRLFSIALGPAGSKGSIVFGGIDSTRYTGPLETLDLINRTEPYSTPAGQNTTAIKEFITTITGAEFKTGDRTATLWSSGSDGTAAWDSDDPAVPVVPETGLDVMTLPTEHYDRYIAPHFPYLDAGGGCICDYADTDDNLTFTFGNKVKIEVGVRNLIKPVLNLTTSASDRYDNGTDRCYLLIAGSVSKASQQNPLYVLAGPVLESMYMVFDMDNNQISIAQAATEVAETSNVIAIEAGPGQVAKVAASLNPSPTSSGDGSSPSGTNTPDPDPVNTGAIAGGVVGGVGGLALIGAAAYFLVRRKRKTETRPMSEIANDFGQDFDGTYVNQPKNPRYNGDPTMG